MTKQEPHLIMLKPSWPGNFRRSIRNKKGDVTKILEFTPGEAVEVTKSELESLGPDIGVCLFPARLDDSGRGRMVEMTADEVKEESGKESEDGDSSEE
jgi:hypothetical protein